MGFELHVLGPGFDLPSIDAECLASILYLRRCLPVDVWKLVPCNSPNRTPFRRLPALRDNDTWVGGYRRIIQYLRSKPDQWDLDHHLTKSQRGDREAYIAFIESQGTPLLDLSLYVSSENYTQCTRPAWGDLLVWPESWILPHRTRVEAKSRSEHLGLSALDVDAAQEEKTEDAGLTAHIPKSLRRPKQTVSGILGYSIQKTRFRLDAVTADFLDPLQDQLGEQKWLLGDQISSVDCLAIAYLSLMQIASLPQAWLHDALTKKYSSLGSWSSTNLALILGRASTTVSAPEDAHLPWGTMQPRSWLEAGSDVAEGVVSTIPLISSGFRQAEVKMASGDSSSRFQREHDAYAVIRQRQFFYTQVVAACVATTSLVGILLHSGVLAFSRRSASLGGTTRRNFGEAGALLGLG